MRSGYDCGLSGPSYESRLALFMEGDQSFEHFLRDLVLLLNPNWQFRTVYEKAKAIVGSNGHETGSCWFMTALSSVRECQLESEILNIITDLIMDSSIKLLNRQ